MGLTSTVARNGAMPGELAHLVAEGLRAQGVEVGRVGGGDEGELTIRDVSGRLVLSVSDTGLVELEYVMPEKTLDPRLAADLACVLLGAGSEPWEYQGNGYGMPGITLKGVAALELRARGLSVELEVYQDTAFFDATCGIRATNPALLGSEVLVEDAGAVTWNRDYWPQYAVIEHEPEFVAWLGGRDEIAADVVAVVSGFVGLLRAQ